MKEELTREVLEAMVNCDGECIGCPAQSVCDTVGIKRSLATSLLAEMDKPKVWDGAPEWAKSARVMWSDTSKNEPANRCDYSPQYTREIPKTRARQIAENIVHGINGKTHGETKDIEYVEGVLNKYAEELKGEA